MPRNLKPEELHAFFPKLQPHNFEISSPATPRYNCLAFANSDMQNFWTPSRYGGGRYWPEHIAREDTLATWTEIFTGDGYEVTNNEGVELGVQKIAIYVDLKTLEPSHVAISDGRSWKSKLGRGQDIQHVSLDILEGDEREEYGIVARVLKRPIE